VHAVVIASVEVCGAKRPSTLGCQS
jgi:hypothetical protein